MPMFRRLRRVFRPRNRWLRFSHQPSWSVYANPAQNASITTLLAAILDDAGHAAAAARVINAGADHFFYMLDWSALEATAGNYTDTLLDRVVTQSGNLPIWLTIATIGTNGARAVPSDLASTAWDDSAMTTAFKNFLTHIQPRLGGRLQKLLIGNESDIYFNNGHTSEIAAYATFFTTVRTHARTLFDVNKLQVGVTFTQAATSHFSDYAAILAPADIASFTYYFLAGNPFLTDLGAILSAIGSKPWIFQEIGFTSDVATWGSSQSFQSGIIDVVFLALPQLQSFIGATWFQLSDYSNAVLSDAGYTSPSLEFYTQIGLRDVNNRAKTAWPTIVGYLGGITGDLPDGHQVSLGRLQSVNRAGTY